MDGVSFLRQVYATSQQTTSTSSSIGMKPLEEQLFTFAFIVGVKFRDGVVLAADTRATGGAIVVEKNC